MTRSQTVANDPDVAEMAEELYNGAPIDWQYWASRRNISPAQAAHLAFSVDLLVRSNQQYGTIKLPDKLRVEIQKLEAWLAERETSWTLPSLLAVLGDEAPYNMKQAAYSHNAELKPLDDDELTELDRIAHDEHISQPLSLWAHYIGLEMAQLNSGNRELQWQCEHQATQLMIAAARAGKLIIRQPPLMAPYAVTETTPENVLFSELPVSKADLRAWAENECPELQSRLFGFEKRQQASTPPTKDAGTIPGRVPTVASCRLAVQAAWEIECETSNRASAKDVMKRMQKWAEEGTHGELTKKLPGNAVEWMTTKSALKSFNLEACSKALENWHKSRV